MLKLAIQYLNALLVGGELVEKTYEICENTEAGLGQYLIDGDFEAVQFDQWNGMSYWEQLDAVTVSKEGSSSRPQPDIQKTYPLVFHIVVKRNQISGEDGYSMDKLATAIHKLWETGLSTLKDTIKAKRVLLDISAYQAEDRGTDYVSFLMNLELEILADNSCFSAFCDTELTLDEILSSVVSCSPASYTNSDGSFSGSIVSGGALAIDDIDVTINGESQGSKVAAVDLALSYTCSPSDEYDYDAENASDTGGAITSVSDIGGANNTAFQDTGSLQPTLNASDSNLNNQASMTFDSDRLKLTIPPRVNVETGMCFFWVGSVDNGQRFDMLGDPGKAQDAITVFEDLGYVRFSSNTKTGSINMLLNAPDMDDYAVWCVTSDGTTAKLFKNGILKDSETTLAENFAPYQIGALSSTSRSKGTMGRLKLVGYYDLADINSFGAEMATKFGFTWNTIS